MNQKVTSDKVKEALQDVIKRKQQLAKVTQDKQRLEEQVKVIGQEQDRIRQNMAQLDHATDLYKRYVKKFGEQEDEVEKLRGEIKKLIDEEAKQRQALDAYSDRARVGLDRCHSLDLASRATGFAQSIDGPVAGTHWRSPFVLSQVC